jgi:prepilin-type processing-associated H-X9-DG protein
MICPSDPARLRLLSYTLNGMYLGYAQDKIASPADKIFMVDECSVSDYVFVYYTAGNYGFHSLAEPGNFVHRHGLNCLYADGHAKWMNEQDWPLGPGDPRFMADFGIK